MSTLEISFGGQQIEIEVGGDALARLYAQQAEALLVTIGEIELTADNSAVGTDTLDSRTTGVDNHALGVRALTAVTSGNRNVASGSDALSAVVTGSDNTGLGHDAGRSYTGSQGTFVGANAGRLAVGVQICFEGFDAGRHIIGDDCAAFGWSALRGLENGGAGSDVNRSTAVGTSALASVDTGADDNTAVGNTAGVAISTGSKNTFVGGGAGYAGGSQLATAVNSAAFGFEAYTNASNQVSLGNSSVIELLLGGRVAVKINIANDNAFGGAGGPAAGTTVLNHGMTAFGINCMTGLVSDASSTACTAFGKDAMKVATIPIDCSAFGAGAFESLISGIGGSAYGRWSQRYNQYAGRNSSYGDSSLEAVTADHPSAPTVGCDDVAMGYGALNDLTFGARCVGIGNYAAGVATTPNNVTAIGDNSFHDLSTGSDNTAIGKYAGFKLTTGNQCVFIGADSGTSGSQLVTASNSIAIGYSANTTKSNQVVLGNTNITETMLTGVVIPRNDNSQTLGGASNRWSTVYAGTGTINTSDETLKTEIGDVPDEWLDAWGDVKWQRFKYRDAVEAKGEAARWHLGAIAQQVHVAFAARGLDAFAIGLCCLDTIEDETAPVAAAVIVPEITDDLGNVKKPAIEIEYATEAREIVREAGEIWGLRYTECLAMEAAWTRRELARLSALIGG